MRHAAHRLQIQGRILCALLDEPSGGFGHDTPFLCPSPALGEHVEIELLGGQSLQGRLANGPEVTFIHVFQEPLLKIDVAELARVIVPAAHAPRGRMARPRPLR